MILKFDYTLDLGQCGHSKVIVTVDYEPGRPAQDFDPAESPMLIIQSVYLLGLESGPNLVNLLDFTTDVIYDEFLGKAEELYGAM